MSVTEHVRNKADERAVDEGCWWDDRGADAIKRFCEAFFRLSDGDYFGQRFHFIPWIFDEIIRPIHCWKRADGTRRFRRGSVWTMKKKAKTTTTAAMALYHLIESPGSLVYVLSSSLKNANTLYDAARKAVEMEPRLLYQKNSKKLKRGQRNGRLWVRRQHRSIEDVVGKSKLEVLSQDPKGAAGGIASCVLVDELADITTTEVWAKLWNSTMARKNGLFLSISTPNWKRHSIAWDQYQIAKAIVDGRDNRTNYLAVVKGVPLENPDGSPLDWSNPDNWWPHIPSLGISVNKSVYLEDFEAAQGNPRLITEFRSLMLAQWTESAEQWLTPSKLDICTRPIDLEALKGQNCYIGIDGAVNQLSAYVLYFPDTKIVLVRLFHPEETAKVSDEKRATKLTQWGQEGHLTLTEGDLSDWSTLEAALKADLEAYNVLEIAFDPAGVEGRMTEFQAESYAPCIPIKPYPSHTAEPTRYLERLIMSGEITLPDNPVMRWCLLNAAVKEDQHDRIFIDREKSGGRYDGASALILALHRVLAAEVQDCVYNHRGVISF